MSLRAETQHYDTPEHRAHIHSPFYFEFLNDFFTHLLVAAWRRDNHAETIPDSAAGDPNPLTCCFSSTAALPEQETGEVMSSLMFVGRE